ncbi:MAG TPA: fibronectin type III-like domain-contianing protein, partial [Chthoniobacterales bacterium]|nr:fibronectin type III-like domain-contianing protein [Chthoniobacterales bacterium]
QQNPTITRPIKELKGFQKVFLQPNQSQTVTVKLNQRSFAYFNTSAEEWDALPGKYNILVGSSSKTSDLKLQGTVDLPSEITANP